MSKIPSYPVQPAGYPQQPGPYSPPAESNGMAVAGFVLSIIGFFTCFLASPIGLILSVIGMKKKEQQGLAIAGLVLGILGTLSFVGFLIYFVIVMIFLGGAFFWTTTAFASAAEQARTNQAIQMARSKIQSHTVHARVLPSDSQGTAMILRSRDAWNQSLRYEKTSDNQFSIISSGPDKKFGTRDDIRREFTSPHITQNSLPAGSFVFSITDPRAAPFAALPP